MKSEYRTELKDNVKETMSDKKDVNSGKKGGKTGQKMGKNTAEGSDPAAKPRISDEALADLLQKTESGNKLERYESKIMYTPEYEKYIDSLILNYHSSRQMKLPPRKRVSIDLEEKIIGTLSARASLKPVDVGKNVGKLTKQGGIKIKHRQALENLVKKHMPADEVEEDEEERDSLQDWITDAIKDIDKARMAAESIASLRSVIKEKKRRKRSSSRPVQPRYLQIYKKIIDTPVMKVGFGSGFREVKKEELPAERAKIMMKEKKVLDIVKSKIIQPTTITSPTIQPTKPLRLEESPKTSIMKSAEPEQMKQPIQKIMAVVPLKLPSVKKQVEAKIVKPPLPTPPPKLTAPPPKLADLHRTSIKSDEAKYKHEVEEFQLELQPHLPVTTRRQPAAITKAMDQTSSAAPVGTRKITKAKPDIVLMTPRTMTLAETKLDVQVKKMARKMFFDPLRVPLGDGSELAIEKSIEGLVEEEGQATIIERRRATKITEHARTRGVVPSYAASSLPLQATPAMRERGSTEISQDRPKNIELTAPDWTEVDEIVEEKNTGIPEWLIKQKSKKKAMTEKKVRQAAPLPEVDEAKREYVRISADLPEIPGTKPATTKYSPSKPMTDLRPTVLDAPRLSILKKTAPTMTITKKAPGPLSIIGKTSAQRARPERVSTEEIKSPEETLATDASEETVAVRPTAALSTELARPDHVFTVGAKAPEETLGTKASVEMAPVRSTATFLTELARSERVSAVDAKSPKATLATGAPVKMVTVRPTAALSTELARPDHVSTVGAKAPEETLGTKTSVEMVPVRPTAALSTELARPDHVSTVGAKAPEETLGTKTSVEMVPVRPTAALSTELARPDHVFTVGAKAPEETLGTKASVEMVPVRSTATFPTELARSERVSAVDAKSPKATLATGAPVKTVTVRPTAAVSTELARADHVSTVGAKAPEETLATKTSVEMVPVRPTATLFTELASPEHVSAVDDESPKANLATEASVEKVSVRPTVVKPPTSIVSALVEEPSVNIFGETPSKVRKRKDLEDRKISVIEGISPLTKPKLLRTKRRELIKFEEREAAKKDIQQLSSISLHRKLKRAELKRYEKPYTRRKKGHEQITENEGKGDGLVPQDDESSSVSKKTRFIRTPELEEAFPESVTSLTKNEFEKPAILLYEMPPPFCIRGIDDPVSILAMPPASQRVMDGTVPTGSSEAFPAEDIINYRPFSREESMVYSVDSSGDTAQHKALDERLLEEGSIRETNFCDIMEQRGFAPKIKRSGIQNLYVWRQDAKRSMTKYLVGKLPTSTYINTKEKPGISHWLKEAKQSQRIGSKVRALKDLSKVNYRSQSLNREAVNQIKTERSTEVSTSRGFAMLEEVRTPQDIRTTQEMEICVKSLIIPKQTEAPAVRRLSKMPSKAKQVSRTKVDRIPLNHKVLSLELFGKEEKRPLSKEKLDKEQKFFPFLSIKKWRK